MAAAGSRTALTDEQERAITARGVSVALSAGAGCGKTFVLTERFLACLDPRRSGPDGPLRLDQLTAITFTERAAREMRERIRGACTRRLLDAPEDQVEHWLRTIRELDGARISTIHSFCGSLLRSHAVEARLDPQFRVLDQAETETLLYELIDAELRERLGRREEAILDLVVQFGLTALGEMIRRLLAQRQEIDWAAWRGTTPEALAARWFDFWRSETLPRVLGQISRSPAAARMLGMVREQMPANPVMRQRCELLVERLPRLPSEADPARALAEIREAAQVQGGGGKKAWPREEIYEAFRDDAQTLRKEIDKVQRQLAFDPQACRPAAEAALRVLSVADGVAVAFDNEKQRLAALDFNDLLIRARDLLAGPSHAELRRRLASQTRLLLVDEFQDTDPLQVELVKALCDGRFADGKLFFVGDYKQSIYRFRGADPHVFRRLREEISVEGRLPLLLNFRSQPAVLDFINALFCEELGPDYEPLRPHRQQVGPVPAVEFLWAVEPEADGSDSGGTVGLPNRDPGTAGQAGHHAERGRGTLMGTQAADDGGSESERHRRREADWIARRIRNMLDSGEKLVWDQEAAKAGQPAARAVRPGDVALLFRALTNIEYYEEALRRYDIDYYLVGGHAFYAQQEIYDVVNLLRTLASPGDQVSLIGVLRSPMFGLLDETLFWLSQHPGGLSGGLFDESSRHTPCAVRRTGRRNGGRQTGHASAVPAACHLAVAAGEILARLPEAQQRRVRFAAATLCELRAIKDRVPIAELLHEALARTGYDAVLLAEFLGERKLANLHKLIAQARAFDASGIFTLSDFITELSQFVARQPDEPLAATQPEAIDAVRLMTIHQSKGLEFPVVVIPYLYRPRRIASPMVAFTPRLGPMVRIADVTSGYDLFLRAESDEDLAELARLLYVATTRSADYLILAAGLPEVGASRGPWTDLLYRRFDPATGQPRAGTALAPGTVPIFAERKWDCPPCAGSVRVTTTEPPVAGGSRGKSPGRDVQKIVEKARQMAAGGGGRVPKDLAPVPPDLSGRRQYSFSRLAGTLHPQAVEAPLAAADDLVAPASLTIDPLGLGTLVHAVLADLTPRRAAAAVSSGDLSALVRRHAYRHLPDADGQLDEPIELIGRFLASQRWAAVMAAEEVHAELEFLLAWPPGSRDSQSPYLQGFIDCLYRDAAGGWRLLDYKTNRVARDDIAKVAAGYEMQMLVYAMAIERILGRPPNELVLHFLRLGEEYVFPWDAAARKRAVEMVDEAMRATRGASVCGRPS